MEARLDALEREQEQLATIGQVAIEWDQLLQGVACSIRVSTQSSTQLSPYALAFGRHPKLLADEEHENQKPHPLDELLLRRDDLEHFVKKARTNITKAQERQQRTHMRRGGQQAV